MVARYRDTRNSLMEFRCICRRVAAFLVVKCLPFAAGIHMVLLDVLLEKRAVHSTCVAINKQQKNWMRAAGVRYEAQAICRCTQCAILTFCSQHKM